MSNTLSPELQLIRNYLSTEYIPVHDPQHADFLLNTQEIHERLRAVFPAEGFTATLLFTWLMELGYQYRDVGEMKVEWLLKRADVLHAQNKP